MSVSSLARCSWTRTAGIPNGHVSRSIYPYGDPALSDEQISGSFSICLAGPQHLDD